MSEDGHFCLFWFGVVSQYTCEIMTFLLSIVSWYFVKGPRLMLYVWGNVLRHLIRLFNFTELSLTLVSPWKRDLTPKNWVGLEIGKTLNRLLMNVFSRIMGLIVRLLVLASGVVVLVMTAIVGILAFPGWFLGIPLFLWLSLGLAIREQLSFGESVAVLVAAPSFLFPLFVLLFRGEEIVLPRDRRELFRSEWFPRILARLGISFESFRPEEWETDEALSRRLSELNVPNETFDEIVSYETLAAELRAKERQPFLWENLRKTVPIGRGWQYGFTVHLDRYCVDLSRGDTSEYSKAHLFGRDDEFRLATLVMRRPGQNNILLIGDPGIGKKTFVHALARKIREGDLPEFGELRFLLLDLGVAVGDAVNRGLDLDNFVRSLFYEAANAGNVVLIVENVDVFLGGEAGRPNLAPIFSEFLASPSFRVIGTIGNGRYNALAHRDEQVLKFFESVYLREPDAGDTVRIMLNTLVSIERIRPLFTWKALQSIVELSGQYEWDTPYPEKALDLMQECFLRWQTEPDGPFITPETVAAFVSVKTGVPVGALAEDEKDRLLRLEDVLHRRVVGQSDAVRQVSEALRRARAGFGNPKRPLGSFLFLGPTGVGKTETAKALSEAYFGDEERMVRLDMSEFQTPDAVERLIGSSVSGEEGRLSGTMKEHPFSVVLLDEIEKAYPKALDLFLQILDEGFVTDGFGKKINFRKSIIIATSNASSLLISELLGHGATPEQARNEVIADIAKQGTFRMEFMNRFDGIIFFSPLGDNELAQVVLIKLNRLSERIHTQKNISVAFAPGVPSAVVERGYEAVFGARSLNRYIEDHIEDVIARKVISGEVTGGGTLLIEEADIT
ncbi:MAG: ATP-dependent Clp protease ATP-binding subunit [Candidatus Moranbacteria bacterium]|nr:ATP-dependent Clp protease ATP-binding subunit [Candidatus Moranbacteria bacterium]NTW75537.1 ATP-dependent Clp protease ATP-binding subunit [Candidatus Moranbacteria bacterium]